MKLLARCDVLVAGVRHKANSVFDASTEAAEVLLGYGWATEVKEEPKEEPKPKKKTTKKK